MREGISNSYAYSSYHPHKDSCSPEVYKVQTTEIVCVHFGRLDSLSIAATVLFLMQTLANTDNAGL